MNLDAGANGHPARPAVDAVLQVLLLVRAWFTIHIRKSRWSQLGKAFVKGDGLDHVTDVEILHCCFQQATNFKVKTLDLRKSIAAALSVSPAATGPPAAGIGSVVRQPSQPTGAKHGMEGQTKYASQEYIDVLHALRVKPTPTVTSIHSSLPAESAPLVPSSAPHHESAALSSSQSHTEALIHQDTRIQPSGLMALALAPGGSASTSYSRKYYSAQPRLGSGVVATHIGMGSREPVAQAQGSRMPGTQSAGMDTENLALLDALTKARKAVVDTSADISLPAMPADPSMALRNYKYKAQVASALQADSESSLRALTMTSSYPCVSAKLLSPRQADNYSFEAMPGGGGVSAAMPADKFERVHLSIVMRGITAQKFQVSFATCFRRALAIAFKLPLSSVRLSPWKPSASERADLSAASTKYQTAGYRAQEVEVPGSNETEVSLDLIDLPDTCDAFALFELIREIASSVPPFRVLERELHFYEAALVILRLSAALFDHSRSSSTPTHSASFYAPTANSAASVAGVNPGVPGLESASLDQGRYSPGSSEVELPADEDGSYRRRLQERLRQQRRLAHAHEAAEEQEARLAEVYARASGEMEDQAAWKQQRDLRRMAHGWAPAAPLALTDMSLESPIVSATAAVDVKTGVDEGTAWQQQQQNDEELFQQEQAARRTARARAAAAMSEPAPATSAVEVASAVFAAPTAVAHEAAGQTRQGHQGNLQDDANEMKCQTPETSSLQDITLASPENWPLPDFANGDDGREARGLERRPSMLPVVLTSEPSRLASAGVVAPEPSSLHMSLIPAAADTSPPSSFKGENVFSQSFRGEKAFSQSFRITEEELRQVFNTLDVNRDGKVSHAEFIKGLRQNPRLETVLGLKVQGVANQESAGRDEYVRRFNAMDVDASKTIDLDEMLQYYRPWLRSDTPNDGAQANALPGQTQAATEAYSGKTEKSASPLSAKSQAASSPIIEGGFGALGEELVLPYLLPATANAESTLQRASSLQGKMHVTPASSAASLASVPVSRLSRTASDESSKPSTAVVSKLFRTASDESSKPSKALSRTVSFGANFEDVCVASDATLIRARSASDTDNNSQDGTDKLIGHDMPLQLINTSNVVGAWPGNDQEAQQESMTEQASEVPHHGAMPATLPTRLSGRIHLLGGREATATEVSCERLGMGLRLLRSDDDSSWVLSSLQADQPGPAADAGVTTGDVLTHLPRVHFVNAAGTAAGAGKILQSYLMMEMLEASATGAQPRLVFFVVRQRQLLRLECVMPFGGSNELGVCVKADGVISHCRDDALGAWAGLQAKDAVLALGQTDIHGLSHQDFASLLTASDPRVSLIVCSQPVF